VFESHLTADFQDFAAWRQSLVDLIEQVAGFSQRLDLLPSGGLLRLEILAREMRAEQFSISLYGEFARGKSELLNAVLFADQGRRFLPAGVGQTTMCPVEISASAPASLSLLPLQASTLHESVQELKKDETHWHRLPLILQDAELTEKVLRRVQETLCVPLAEARRFGLCPPLDSTRPELSHCPSCGEGKVRISRWRYAMLRLPAPILPDGLVVIDTPGLNSLGSEADLGLDALRMSDASVLVLAADSGLTQSDLQIWDFSLTVHNRERQLVLLNKCDLLGGEGVSAAERTAMIEEARRNTSERLQIPLDRVLAISARDALIGRIRGDPERIARSGIEPFEQAIGSVLVRAKKREMVENSKRLLERVLLDQRFVLEEQMISVRSELDSMRRLETQTGEQVPKLLERQSLLMDNLNADWKNFLDQQQEFRRQAKKELLESLSLTALEALIEKAKAEILAVWTTFGIYERFAQFFVGTIAGFDDALLRANRLSEQMMQSYRGLEQKYALPKLDTIPYLLLPRRAELLALSDYYERFGKRLEIAAYPQSMVVKKSFLKLANQVRNFVLDTRNDLLVWLDESLEMMNSHIERCQEQAQEKYAALHAIAESTTSVQQRIESLRVKESHVQYDSEDLDALQRMMTDFFRKNP
jgi:hypothetical protein